MLIISVRDNENNRWKRNSKTKQNKTKTKQKLRQRITRGTEAIVKGWELNDYPINM